MGSKVKKAQPIDVDVEIFDAIIKLDKQFKKQDRYFVLYTHRWEQGDMKHGNILVTPKDKRFDKAEFTGLIVDILRDYAKGTKWNLKGSVELKALIRILEDLYEGRLDA